MNLPGDVAPSSDTWSAFSVGVRGDLPHWALLQRQLIARLRDAAHEYVARYTRDDGTLIWRDRWAGMDGSDDPYEAFMYLALLYSVSGDDSIFELARRMWDSITWQWTQYGQVDREFDRYYDWMHHGEGNLFHYFFGLCKPESLVERQRADRFASFYDGRDHRANNWDGERKLIRSANTGSDGPRFVITAEDFSTHREVLSGYLPPFEDLDAVPFDGRNCDWEDDQIYAEVLAKMNERTTRGDVPLNLNATGILTHAFLYSGDEAQRRWVIDYLAAWSDRARANGGIIPDNVGLSGEIGEYLDGKWWGGHYGWRWPHGFPTIIEPVLNAGMNAFLLTGDEEHLDLARTQLDLNFRLGRWDGDDWLTPFRRVDAGWTDFRPAEPHYPIHLWATTLNAEDRERVDRLPRTRDWSIPWVPHRPFAAKHFITNTCAWYEFITGATPDYPEQMIEANLDLVEWQLERMRSWRGDPNNWDSVTHLDDNPESPSLRVDGFAIHAWQECSPVYLEALVQLAWGAPMHLSHGGLQRATIRYFDCETRRPGLPEGVSALISEITADSVRLELVNTGAVERSLVLQAGGFGEHRITRLRSHDEQIDEALDSVRYVEVSIAPSSVTSLQLSMARYAATPSYESPWSGRADWAPLIRPRMESPLTENIANP